MTSGQPRGMSRLQRICRATIFRSRLIRRCYIMTVTSERPRGMSRTAWAAITVMVTAMLTAALLTMTGTIGSHAGAPCHASQPVYAGTADVGARTFTLHTGQSVTLPDGDTATCTNQGLDVH